jgi:hypothetical protein
MNFGSNRSSSSKRLKKFNTLNDGKERERERKIKQSKITIHQKMLFIQLFFIHCIFQPIFTSKINR